MIAALQRLDEPIVLTSESNADGKMETKRMGRVHFDLVTKIKLGRNLKRLKLAQEEIQDARDKGFKEYASPSESNPEKLVLKGEEGKKFQVEMADLLRTEADVDIEQIQADTHLTSKDHAMMIEVIGELWDTIFVGDIK